MAGNTWILIQCRSDSERYPDKFEAQFGKAPLLQVVYSNCKQTSRQVAVICPEDDQKMQEFCKSRSLLVLTGPKNDVLRRYLVCAEQLGADNVLRVTGDCPLIPLELTTFAYSTISSTNLDVISNVFQRSYPDGYDTEALSMKALRWLDKHATSEADREHVTSYLYSHDKQAIEDGLMTASMVSPLDLSRIKCSIDVPEDIPNTLKLMSRISK